MQMLSDAQIAAGVRARDAINLDQGVPTQLSSIVAGAMSQAWSPVYQDVFAALGTRAAGLEARLGVLIGAALMLGVPYASIPKPIVCYGLTNDGQLIPTNTPFPADGLMNGQPLAKWGIHVADAAAVESLIAQGDAAVLAALAAANA